MCGSISVTSLNDLGALGRVGALRSGGPSALGAIHQLGALCRSSTMTPGGSALPCRHRSISWASLLVSVAPAQPEWRRVLVREVGT